MKRILTWIIAFVFALNLSIGQEYEGPEGTFVGPLTQVICGHSQTTNAIYYIVVTADDYSQARGVAHTTIDRFTQFYQNYPDYLSEFYNCRPLECKPPSSCESEASLIGIDPIQLLPLGANLYLLQMDISYKVTCFSCIK